MAADETPDPEKVEARLRAGEWLGTTDVAVLFPKSRGGHVRRETVWDWAVRRGRIGYRQPATGGAIELDPKDVLALLDERRRVRRASPQPAQRPTSAVPAKKRPGSK